MGDVKSQQTEDPWYVRYDVMLNGFACLSLSAVELIAEHNDSHLYRQWAKDWAYLLKINEKIRTSTPEQQTFEVSRQELIDLLGAGFQLVADRIAQQWRR